MNCDRFAFTRDFKLILLVIGLLFFFIISVRLDLEETPLSVKTKKRRVDGILREKARLVRSICRLGGPPESSNPSANWLSQFRTIVKREYPFTKYWNENHWGNNLHRTQLLSCEIGNKNDITTITETNRKENHQEGEQQNFWILWVWSIRSNTNLSITKEWNAKSVWNCDFSI